MQNMQNNQNPNEFRRLNPRLDFNFKGIFTQDRPESRIALKSFLSAMIGEEVTEVTVKENEPAGQYEEQRGIRYDINGFPSGKPMSFCYAETHRNRPIYELVRSTSSGSSRSERHAEL